MKIQKLLTLALITVLVLSACGPTPTAVPTIVSNSPTQGVVATLPVEPTSTPMTNAAITEASPTFEIAPTVTGNLPFQIISPLDGDIVNTPQVDVIGSAPSGTVVSVNDDILVVGDNGQFRSIVPLEEGPNLIEIVASDDNGSETDLTLTVIYEP